MKRKVYPLLACILGAGLLTAAAQDESLASRITPKTFNLDSGVWTASSDFGTTRGGYSIGGAAYWSEHVGLGLEARSLAAGGVWCETLHARLLVRCPLTSGFALVPYAGGIRHWELREYGLEAGVRAEQKLYRALAIYGQVGWQKLLDAEAPHEAVAGIGLTVSF